MVDQLVSGGPTPGIGSGAGAGTGPTLTIAGDNSAGVITVTTGTTPSASAPIVSITFSPPLATTPRSVMIAPANAAAAALTTAGKVYENQSVRSATQFVLTSGATALTASTTYVWSYAVIE